MSIVFLLKHPNKQDFVSVLIDNNETKVFSTDWFGQNSKQRGNYAQRHRLQCVCRSYRILCTAYERTYGRVRKHTHTHTRTSAYDSNWRTNTTINDMARKRETPHKQWTRRTLFCVCNGEYDINFQTVLFSKRRTSARTTPAIATKLIQMSTCVFGRLWRTYNT